MRDYLPNLADPKHIEGFMEQRESENKHSRFIPVDFVAFVRHPMLGMVLMPIKSLRIERRTWLEQLPDLIEDRPSSCVYIYIGGQMAWRNVA